MIRMIFSTVRAPHEPAFTVESLAMSATGRPSTVAVPVITPSAGRPSASTLAKVPSSTNDPSSTSSATRARLHRGVVGDERNRPAGHVGRAGDHAVGRQAVGEYVGEGAAPYERPLVDQQRHPSAGEQLALGRVGGVVLLRPAAAHPLAQL